MERSCRTRGVQMVEAAGVEPAQTVENTEVVDSRKGQNGKKGQKGKSTVQTLYKIKFSSTTGGLIEPPRICFCIEPNELSLGVVPV
jgi:hypothetical protein